MAVDGAIEGGRDYASLLPESVELTVEGQRVRVVKLETLAALKRGSRSPKDQLVVAMIEQALRTRDRG